MPSPRSYYLLPAWLGRKLEARQAIPPIEGRLPHPRAGNESSLRLGRTIVPTAASVCLMEEAECRNAILQERSGPLRSRVHSFAASPTPLHRGEVSWLH